MNKNYFFSFKLLVSKITYRIFNQTAILIFLSQSLFPNNINTDDKYKLNYECSHWKSSNSKLRLKSTLTENQEKIDVKFYSINLDIDFDQEIISGLVKIDLEVGFNQPDTIELDFSSNMTVDSIISFESIIGFIHNDNKIKIPVEWANNSEGYALTLYVHYHGTPNQSGFAGFIFDTHSDIKHIWTLSEPYGARSWWPCKDDPSDKADSVDIIISVPASQGHLVASNGLLYSDSIDGFGKRKFHWKERYPISTYLVSLAIYPYALWHDYYISPLSGDSLRLDYYVYPDNYENSFQNYLLTKDMMSFFSTRFGEYPFINEKYGHADFGWGGGMEHQTLSSMGSSNESLIAHEVAHQWWGNLVTCKSFHDIWLNEGFARYAQALWEENKGGFDSYSVYMNAHAFYGDGTIYVENPSSVSDIFNGNLVYNKASWVLHMLRKVVGDDHFFEILKSYRNNDLIAYSNATTLDFKTICEIVSGKDLENFFQRWIYGEKYPHYELSFQKTIENEYHLTITQLQNVGVFILPIDLHITGPSVDTIIVVENNQINQDYILPDFNSDISNITLDPNNWILKEVDYLYIDNQIIPREISFSAIYPNPFNSTANFQFYIPNSIGEMNVGIDIYDIRGGFIENILKDKIAPGFHNIVWNASTKNSGIYFVRLETKNEYLTQKIIYLK